MQRVGGARRAEWRRAAQSGCSRTTSTDRRERDSDKTKAPCRDAAWRFVHGVPAREDRGCTSRDQSTSRAVFPDGPGDQGSIDIVSECPVLADPSVVAGHGAGDPVPTEGGRVVHRLACQYDLTFGNLLFHIGSAGASPSDPSSIHIMLIGPPLPSMPAIVLRIIPR